MVAAILISIILVLLTLCLHQASFVWLARSIPIGARSTHPGLYLLMLGVFAVHILEILLYAICFYVAINVFELGSLEGARASGVLGYFYASSVFYTSLGFGDVLPNGHLRFIVSIEALNGLLLIAWSAAFIFAVMGKSWHCFSGPGANNPGDKTKAKI
jgi:ion channel